MTSEQEKTDRTSTMAAGNAHVVHSFMHFMRIVRYRKGVVIASVVVGVALGALYFTTTTRFFESTAGLLVMQTGNDVHGTQITPEGARAGLMPTYERIIRSSEVLESAVKRLAPADRVDLQDVKQQKWSSTIRGNLSVATVRNSNIIEVTYRSRTPEAAASVVQAIVDSYLEYMRKTNEGAAAEILRILTVEKEEKERLFAIKRNEVTVARQQMLDIGYRTDDGPLHPIVKQAVSLNEALTDETKKRVALQTRLESIQVTVRTGGDLTQHMIALEGEIGRDLVMKRIGLGDSDAGSRIRLEQKLITDHATYESLLQGGYGQNHPLVWQKAKEILKTQNYLNTYQQRVDAKLAQLQNSELGPLLVSIVEQNLAQVQRHENALAQQYAQAEANAIALLGKTRELETLEQDEQFLRGLLNGLLEKIARVDLTQDQGIIRTRVTDLPQVVHSPVWPRLPIVGFASLVAGLAVGVGIVSVLDVLDDRFRSPEEMQDQLVLPVLALVRKLSSGTESGIEGLQMRVAPDAPESEAFRTLRTAIAFSGQESGRIVVSSAEPGDGKTTVLANLGATCARAGKRTLLIDADMRKPGLTKLMRLGGRHGLTQLLQSETPVSEMAEQLIQPTGIERLDVIPSGPRQANPAELLSGNRLPELLAWAETVYDQIVIDAPPAVAAADASIVSAIADGLILVVRPEKNKRQEVVRAVDGFRGLGVHLIGLVVNGLGSEGQAYYTYSDGYGYGESPDGTVDTSPDVSIAARDHGVALDTGDLEIPDAEAAASRIDADEDRPISDYTLGRPDTLPPILPRRAA